MFFVYLGIIVIGFFFLGGIIAHWTNDSSLFEALGGSELCFQGSVVDYMLVFVSNECFDQGKK